MRSLPNKTNAISPKWTREQRGVITSSTKKVGVRIIDATAGSGKTTLLTGVAIENLKHHKNTLFISLTNSVRYEIGKSLRWQLEKLANIKIIVEERHQANHDYFDVSMDGSLNLEIQIATIDSWIHQCLIELGFEVSDASIMSVGGMTDADQNEYEKNFLKSLLPFHVDNYTKKREAFFIALCHGRIPKEALAKYDIFMLDEVQDLDQIFIDISVLIGELFAKQGKSVYFAGDINQHIFGNATCMVISELKKRLSKSLGPSKLLWLHNLTICFRCPPAHLKFVNHLFPDQRPTRWAKGKADGEPPILLGVPSGPGIYKVKAKAEKIVEEICQAIKDGYSLKDIVIISPYSRMNGVYCQLENILSHKFCKTSEKITWLYTDGEHCADWSRALDKLTLSSIHANKGRTHKMVIVLGLIDGALPRLKVKDFSSSKRIDWHTEECLLFVALTRSNGRLVLVIEEDSEKLTYFLRRAFKDGQELLKYCTPRSSASQILGWKWNTDAPSRQPMTISKTVTGWAKEIKRLENILNWIPQPTIHKFSNSTCSLTSSKNDEIPELLKTRNLLDIYGHFGSLAYYRELRKLPLPLLAYKHAIVTPMNSVANAFRFRRAALREMDDPDLSEKEIATCVLSGMRESSKAEAEEILRLASEMIYRPYAHIISERSMGGHGITTVLRSIKDYERDVPTEELDPNTLWALSLAMGAMNTGRFERPWLNSQLHCSVLHHTILPKLWHNIKEAAKFIGSRTTGIEVPVYDKEYSLGGRIDLVLNDGTILDIKCPISEGYPSNSWVQLALYARLADWNVPYIGVLDLAHGKLEYVAVKEESLQNILENGKKYLIESGYVENV